MAESFAPAAKKAKIDGSLAEVNGEQAECGGQRNRSTKIAFVTGITGQVSLALSATVVLSNTFLPCVPTDGRLLYCGCVKMKWKDCEGAWSVPAINDDVICIYTRRMALTCLSCCWRKDTQYVCVCVCVCVHLHVCVRLRVCVHLHVCVSE